MAIACSRSRRLPAAAWPTATLILWLPVVAIHAANFAVTANPDLTFTPAELTIHQGDTVTFRNAGGVHNVHADNDRFICSVNCTTNNAPSDLPWSATVLFNRTGSFGYYCEAHGDLTGGMRGSITVIDRIFVDGFDTPMTLPDPG
ncbi:MAG TPA: plastocyanin/azurin family copper-binding protein [Rhodanobacteraceae bacterium]|nr:plastocyanin/azurin family copper-binding protein [Rhodanobacteraceae bacterium]